MQRKLKAEYRQGTGKSVTRKLRAQGKIPAILYGAGEQNRLLQLDAHEMDVFLRHQAGESPVVHLEIDGETLEVIIKEVQREPVFGKLLHVDFQVLHKGEKVIVEVPVVLKGEAVGVKKGGVLEQLVREVEIRAIPSKLPSAIEVDVSDLDIGDAVHVRDLKVEEGVEILEDPEQTVVTILAPKKAAEEEAEAEAPPAEGEAEAGEGEAPAES